jgi:hypothetical protein
MIKISLFLFTIILTVSLSITIELENRESTIYAFKATKSTDLPSSLPPISNNKNQINTIEVNEGSNDTNTTSILAANLTNSNNGNMNYSPDFKGNKYEGEGIDFAFD